MEDYLLPFQSSSIDFLASQGFDFNKVFCQGERRNDPFLVSCNQDDFYISSGSLSFQSGVGEQSSRTVTVEPPETLRSPDRCPVVTRLLFSKESRT